MTQKHQLLIIHGGMTFRSRKDYINFLKNRPITIEKKIRWYQQYLDQQLGETLDIIRPQMPLKENAKYKDWKIHFERYIPYLRDGLILIGISLGGTFLAKYLSENPFPRDILSVYLIAPPFDDTLIGEDLTGGFKLKKDLKRLEQSTSNLYLMFSKDDPVVPISHAEKYKAKLPNAKIIVFESKNGHFKVPEFPEIIQLIKQNLNTYIEKNT